MSLHATPHWQAAEAVPPEPWRNGGGSTRTLMVWPPSPGGAAGEGWRLRISLADITRDGPFSPFAGVRRGFAVVQGAGVRLSWPQQQLAMTPDTPPLMFDGADAPGCALLDGPTRDLNLMLRGLEGGLLAAQAGTPWQPPVPGAWCACFSTGAGRLLAADGNAPALTWPAMGLVVGLAVMPPTRPWRWQPDEPTARAWWLWADLRPALTPPP